MTGGPGGGRWGSAGGGRELLDLALTAQAAVGWRFEPGAGGLSWGAGMGALLGLPEAADEVIRARLLELIEPWTVAAGVIGAARRDLDLEQPIRTGEGEPRLLHLRARPLAGAQAGLVGLARDVTGLHEERQNLADLAGRYRLLVELSPEAICVHQDEIIKFANPAMAGILGADSAAQLLEQPLADFVDPGSIPRMRERIRRLTATGETTPRERANLRRLDGTPVPVELVSVRTTWRGRPAQQVIGRDITTEQAAEMALRYQAALVDHVSNAIIALDWEAVVTSWNPAAEAVYGVRAEDAVGQPVAELVGADVHPRELLAVGGVAEVRHRRSDGAPLVIRLSVAPMDSGFVLVCADDTARRRAEQDFATVVNALDEGIVVLGPSGVINSANPAAERILGVPRSAMVGSRPTAWRLYDEAGQPVRPEDYPSVATQRSGIPQTARVARLQRPDGSSVWLSLTTRQLGEQGRPPHAVVSSFTDITDRRAARERLEHEATHDPLTGQANRTLVLRHLERAHRERRPMAVLFVDLDNFKLINDSLGHPTGDEVLQVIGRRLVEATGPGHVVGRLGGDEFVVLVPGEVHHRALGELCAKLLDFLAEPIRVQGRQLHLSTSIGIAVSPAGDDRATGGELLRDADVAMYRAKTSGGGRFAFFDVELRDHMQRHLILEQDLRHAVREDQLWVAYQPVVDLAAHRAVAVEGLLRWSHPEHGTVSPAEFIPLAEASDLINHLGAHMLRTATRELADERRRSGLDLQLNANLSPRQLEDPQLRTIVARALAEAGLPASALCLEITENAIMHDPATAAQALTGLRELGVALAIDDFGTGHSSLAQLRRMPLDTLKVDRSFITDLAEDRETQVIVSSIIAMAHAMGLTVIAEGIETPQQLEVLHRLGCDHAQGFHLGKPAPIGRLSMPA